MRVKYREKLCFHTFLILICMLSSCKSSSYLRKTELTDLKASKTLKKTYLRIRNMSRKEIALGHQDATAYGVVWKHDGSGTLDRSDIDDVTGKFPAVYGFDIGHIELGNTHNLDSVPFDLMRKLIVKAHENGGIVTLSWHADNPVSGGSSWDTVPAVSQILKGGNFRKRYEGWMEKVALFIRSLKDAHGQPVPVVFRPFHEMNGSWFWWGAGNCSINDYVQLWRETVNLLRYEHKVHNVLYAYSPNTLNEKEEYLRFYPGDDFVDILGIDIYNHSGDDIYREALRNDIAVMRAFAASRDKPFALTETGNIQRGHPRWWTEVLYPAVKNSGIAWLLVWRNHSPEHFFASYPEDPLADDFRMFGEHKDILFLKDIREIGFEPRPDFTRQPGK